MRIKKTASFNVKEGVKSVRYSDLNSGIQYLPADGIINIKSEKVRIAGFGVNESSLYKIDVNGTPYSIGSANSIYLSNTGIITSKSIGGSKGTLSWAMAISDKFGVTVDGTLYAMGGHFAGTIEAKSGKIGTTLINEDGSIVSANGGFRLDANGDLTISHVGGSQLVQDAQTALSTANNANDKASQAHSLADTANNMANNALNQANSAVNQANMGMNKWLVTKYDANGKSSNTITTIPLLLVNQLTPESTMEYDNAFSSWLINGLDGMKSGIKFSDEKRVAYAITYVKFNADTTVSNFALGTDDGGTLYLNGSQTIRNGSYGLSVGVSVTFKKGWNVIEVVVHNYTGAGGFALATYDSTNKTYSVLDLTKLVNFERMDCYCSAFSGQTAYGLAVNAKVLETSSSLETVSRTVTDNKNGINDLMTRTSQVETNVTNLKALENTHYSTMTTQYNNQQKTIDGTVTRLGKAEDRITTVSNDLSNLSIGGRNLIVLTTSRDGYRLDVSGNDYADQNNTITDYFDVLPSCDYTMSISKDLPILESSYYELCLYDKDKKHISRVIMYGSGSFKAGREHGVTIKSQSNAVYGKISFPINAKKYVKFELGNKATDWTPAPEDFENKISEQSTALATYKQTTDQNLAQISSTYQRKDGMSNYATNSSVTSAINQAKTDITASVSSNYVKTADYNTNKQVIEARMSSAEQKITDSAIISTVTKSTNWSDLQKNASKLDWQIRTDALDLNSMKTDGRYLLKGGLTNAYSGCSGWQYLIVESVPNQSRVTQTMWNDNGVDNTGYTRKLDSSGSWTPWVREANTANAISVINQSSESIKIQANRIDIDGLVTFNNSNNAIANKIKNDINNVQVGGTNLCLNSAHLEKINIYGHGSSVKTQAINDGGNYDRPTNALKITLGKGEGNTGFYFGSNYLDKLVDGHEYVVSMYICCQNRDFDNFNFVDCEWMRNKVWLNNPKNDRNNEQRIAFRGTYYKDAPHKAMTFYPGNISEGEEYWISAIQVEEGNKLTAWSPAPEDVDASVADAKKAGTDAQTAASNAQSTANTAVSNAKTAQDTADSANEKATATDLLVSNWCNINDKTLIDGSKIYTGTITADKLNVNEMKGTNGVIYLKDGTFDYGNGKLKWDGSTLTINGNGTFNGNITATNGEIGGWSIYSDSLKAGSQSEWINYISEISPNQFTIQYNDSGIGIGKLWDGKYYLRSANTIGDASYIYGESDNLRLRAYSLFSGDSVEKFSITNRETPKTPQKESLVEIGSYGINIESYEHNNNSEGDAVQFGGGYKNKSTIYIDPDCIHLSVNQNLYFSMSSSKLTLRSVDLENLNSLCFKDGMTLLNLKDYSTFNNYIEFTFNNYSGNNVLGVSCWKSDKTLKTNILDTNVNGSYILKNIEFKQFDWISTGKHENIGVIAQDLEKIDENLVLKIKQSNGSYTYQINPNEFATITAKSLQEQITRIDNIESNASNIASKIENTKNELLIENQKLKARLDYLEAKVKYMNGEKSSYSE